MGEILAISTPSQLYRNELCNGIGRLLDSESVGGDFELLCADSTPIKAHFFVLQIFCRALQNSNCRRICFESAEIQREDVRCLLEFIYRGETRIEVKRLDAVKRAAVKLRLETFLDLAKGIHNESLEIQVEKETDTKNEEEVCESLAEDEDNVEEDEDSNSVDPDYTECSEEEEEQKSNVGKHEINGDIRKHLASKKCKLDRSYQNVNINAHLPTKHAMDSNCQFVFEKIMKCDQCEYTCAAESLLKTHIKNAHFDAANKSELKRRKFTIHSNARSHTCETCGKCFRDPDLLRNHKMAHAAKVDCELCGKKFTLSTIYRHRKLHEVGGNAKKYKCTICPFRGRDRYNLKIHIKRKHDMSEKKIAQLINSQAVRISDEDEPQPIENSGKIRRSLKSRKEKVVKAPKVDEGVLVCEVKDNL